MRNELGPVGGLLHRCRDELEILGILVGANIEEAVAVIDVVAVFILARQHNLKRTIRLIAGQIARFAGERTGGIRKNEFTIVRAMHRKTIQFVLFFAKKLVLAVAETMT